MKRLLGIPLSSLHVWVTSLWYPAILGAMIMAYLDAEPKNLANSHWAPVLIAYFALQYGEGVGRRLEYDIPAFLSDVAEVLVILLAFHLMGVQPIRFVAEAQWLTLPHTLAAAFAIPVLARLWRTAHKGVRWLKGDRTRSRPVRPLFLTVMSLAAAITAYNLHEREFGAVIVACILAIYLFVCVPPRRHNGSPWDLLRRSRAAHDS